jgi:hypothetical protein
MLYWKMLKVSLTSEKLKEKLFYVNFEDVKIYTLAVMVGSKDVHCRPSSAKKSNTHDIIILLY